MSRPSKWGLVLGAFLVLYALHVLLWMELQARPWWSLSIAHRTILLGVAVFGILAIDWVSKLYFVSFFRVLKWWIVFDVLLLAIILFYRPVAFGLVFATGMLCLNLAIAYFFSGLIDNPVWSLELPWYQGAPYSFGPPSLITLKSGEDTLNGHVLYANPNFLMVTTEGGMSNPKYSLEWESTGEQLPLKLKLVSMRFFSRAAHEQCAFGFKVNPQGLSQKLQYHAYFQRLLMRGSSL